MLQHRAAVQEGDEAFFDHLLEQLAASEDATLRGRILAALGNAEEPGLSSRALDLALDSRLRLNETSRVLGPQFRNPRTRDRAWSWLQAHFDELSARMGRQQAGGTPWYAATLCTRDAADEVQAFFEPKVSALAGGPRNLATVVETITLCSAKAEAQRPGIERAFGVTGP